MDGWIYLCVCVCDSHRKHSTNSSVTKSVKVRSKFSFKHCITKKTLFCKEMTKSKRLVTSFNFINQHLPCVRGTKQIFWYKMSVSGVATEGFQYGANDPHDKGLADLMPHTNKIFR